jgi:hypothetical protein
VRPGAARATLLSFCGPTFWRTWEHVAYSLETGKSAFKLTWGMPIFDFFGEHPDEAVLFSEAMVGFHGGEPPAVAQAYDFSPFQTVVDVGGATGNMLAEILSHYAGRAASCSTGRRWWRTRRRCSKGAESGPRDDRSGKFFDSVPSGADCYVLSHIIHDWTDSQCATILGHCRNAIHPDGRAADRRNRVAAG